MKLEAPLPKDAYLVLVTWPDGSEGMLFPRPGHVPVADTVAAGLTDFVTAKQHLLEWAQNEGCRMPVATIRLIHFVRGEILETFTL